MSGPGEAPPVDENKNPDGVPFNGTPCASHSTCTSMGFPSKSCGYPGTDDKHKVCCPFGTFASSNDWDKRYCRSMPAGYFCETKRSCNNDACGHPQGRRSAQRICCFGGVKGLEGGREMCENEKPGKGCTKDHQCSSLNCQGDGTCAATKSLGFGQKIERVFIFGLIALVVVILIIVIFKFA